MAEVEVAEARGALSRGLAVLETLSASTDGVSLGQVAEATGLPKSAAHRILRNLVTDGYVRQVDPSGDYTLTLKIVSAALRYLAGSTIADIATPILQELAAQSNQLVRLSLSDHDRLVWVARFQGASSGLRYDPDVDQGQEVPLDASASGFAWLSTLSDSDVLRLVAINAAPRRHQTGPAVPRTIEDVLAFVHEARAKGYSEIHDTNEIGIAAVAAPLYDAHAQLSWGAVSIAGPSVQLTKERISSLVGPLQSAATKLVSVASTVPRRHQWRAER